MIDVSEQSAASGSSCESSAVASLSAETLWLVTSDGKRHPASIWTGKPKRPVIVYLHGIEGHSRWFEPTAAALNKQGITTVALDRRGAGASREPRGDIESGPRLLADVDELVARISERHPGCPLFLVANCWGGKLAIVAAAGATGRLLSGLILTSPAVSTRVDVDLKTKLRIACNYLFAGGKGYFPLPLTPAHFTDNPAYRQFIDSDPLRLQEATARFLIESLKLTRQCRKAAARLTVPLLVLQSGRDAIVDTDGLQSWFKCAKSKDKTLKFFTSAAHSLDFEADPTDYQNLLSSWIFSRVVGQPGQGVQ